MALKKKNESSSERRAVDKRYKDPPRYQFIYGYEKQFRRNFEITLRKTHSLLKLKLDRILNESK